MRLVIESQMVIIDSNFSLSNIFCGSCYLDQETGGLTPSSICGEGCIENCKILNTEPQYDIYIKFKAGDKIRYMKYQSKTCHVLTEEEFENA